MKKIITFLISICIVVMSSVVAFSANSAQFNLTIVSQTNTEIKVSVDYVSGSSFNALDMTLEYNQEKLQVESAATGAGLKAFKDDAEGNNGMVLATVNKEINPMKMTMATTANYKNVNGKDLFVFNFKKLNSASVSADDLTLKVTNCSDASNNAVQAFISSDFGSGSGASSGGSENTKASSNSDNNSSGQTSSGETASAADESNSETDAAITGGSGGTSVASDQEVIANKNSDKKKIVIIVAAALSTLLVIAAIIVYVVKKTKDKEVETDVDPLDNSEKNDKE
jgi:hypothetical protein